MLDESRVLLIDPVELVELGGFEDSPSRVAAVEVLLVEKISLMLEFLFKNGLAVGRGGVVGLDSPLVLLWTGDVLLWVGLPVLSKDGWGL